MLERNVGFHSTQHKDLQLSDFLAAQKLFRLDDLRRRSQFLRQVNLGPCCGPLASHCHQTSKNPWNRCFAPLPQCMATSSAQETSSALLHDLPVGRSPSDGLSLLHRGDKTGTRGPSFSNSAQSWPKSDFPRTLLHGLLLDVVHNLGFVRRFGARGTWPCTATAQHAAACALATSHCDYTAHTDSRSPERGKHRRPDRLADDLCYYFN